MLLLLPWQHWAFSAILTAGMCLSAGACSLFLPPKKPVPAALDHDPALESAAMQAIAQSGLNADPIGARVVSPFSTVQNELTGVPTHRVIEIVVMVKSRVLDDTCSWARYRFSQRHAGAGSYDAGLKKDAVLESAPVDCDDPSLVGAVSAAQDDEASRAPGSP